MLTFLFSKSLLSDIFSTHIIKLFLTHNEAIILPKQLEAGEITLLLKTADMN